MQLHLLFNCSFVRFLGFKLLETNSREYLVAIGKQRNLQAIPVRIYTKDYPYMG